MSMVYDPKRLSYNNLCEVVPNGYTTYEADRSDLIASSRGGGVFFDN